VVAGGFAAVGVVVVVGGGGVVVVVVDDWGALGAFGTVVVVVGDFGCRALLAVTVVDVVAAGSAVVNLDREEGGADSPAAWTLAEAKAPVPMRAPTEERASPAAARVRRFRITPGNRRDCW
jgi:hypothetical protein